MADTTVTGKIGDQEVQLINAASEATLQKLLEAFNKSNGTGAGGGSSSGGTAGTPAQAASNTTTAFNRAGDAVGKFAGAVADATSKLLGFAGNLIGGTAKVMLDLSKELLMGGDRVSDFTKHLANLPSIFGVLGGLVNSLSNYIDKTIDTFRSLSQVGANFGNDITAMRQTAAQSGMNMDRFAKFVQQNSEALAALSGTVTQGAKRFGELSKNMREGQAGQRLLEMGFTVDELNETLVTYASINSRMGRDRQMSDKDLISSAGVFGEELNKAAAASGLSRQALMKGADAMSRELSIYAMKSRLPKDKQEGFEIGLTQLLDTFKVASPMLLEGAKGFVSSAEGIALSSISPEFANTMKSYARGQISATEAQNRMVVEAQNAQKRLGAMSEEEIDAREKMSPGFKMAYAAVMDMASKTIKSQKEIDEAMAKAKRNKSIEEFYLKFSDVIERFRGKLMDTLLKSPAFTRLSGMLDNLLQGADEKLPKLLESIIVGFEMFINGISDFITDVQNPKIGWSGAMKNAYENILKNLFSIKPEDLIDKDGNAVSVTEAAMKKIGSAIGDALATMMPILGSALKSMFASLGTQALEWSKNHWKEIGLAIIGMFALAKIGGMLGSAVSGMMGGGAAAAGGAAASGGMGAGLTSLAGGLAAFANPASLIGLAAVTAAVYALSLAFEAASPGFEAFGAMVKRILEGVAPVVVAFGTAVGTVMKDVGTAITNAKDGFTAIFNGIAEVVKSIGSVIIGSITAIGDSISKIINTISNYRTAGTKIATDSIKELANIPSANMLAAAAGVEAIKKALDGFNPGFLSGISQGLGSIFAGDQTGPLQQMAVLGPKLQNAAAGFTAFKTAIDGMKLANLSMTNDQTSSFETLTKRLPDFTTTITALGTQAANINATAVAINAFKQATTGFDLKDFSFSKEQLVSLADGTTKLRQLSEQLKSSKDGFQKLDQQGLKNIKEGVEGLSKAFKDFNESFINKFIPKFEELRSKTQEGILTDLGSKLDTLNSNVASLVTIEDTSKRYLDTIASKKAGQVYK
jgi:hypothetical protein